MSMKSFRLYRPEYDSIRDHGRVFLMRAIINKMPKNERCLVSSPGRPHLNVLVDRDHETGHIQAILRDPREE